MGRKFDPKQHSVKMTSDEFTDAIAEEFSVTFRGMMTVDELVLHPREALESCDRIRRTRGWFLLPDDIILRTLMKRRKNPKA